MIVWISFIILILIYIIIEKAYQHYWDAHLNIEVSLPSENVHEGDVALITEIILNDKWLPLPILEVFFYLDKGLRYTDISNASVSDKLYRRDVFAVGSKRKIRRTFEITCTKRGYYTLENLEMMSYDLFMVKKFLGSTEMFDDFHVYPRKVRSDRIALPYQQIIGDLAVRKNLYEDPFAFGGLRDYVDTDPMSKVNWNATAKSQGLIVNTFDSTNNQNVTILLDTHENRNSFSGPLNEESICIASALIERLLIQGVELTLEGNALDIVSKERLSLQKLKGLGISLIKQYLSRIELGDESPLTSNHFPIDCSDYIILISKNTNLEDWVRSTFKNYIWIVPYRFEQPSMLSIKEHCLPWKLESGDLQ
ncbi:MAG: DUF58 domain-containing protein [Eubacteriales bacterium]